MVPFNSLLSREDIANCLIVEPGACAEASRDCEQGSQRQNQVFQRLQELVGRNCSHFCASVAICSFTVAAHKYLWPQPILSEWLTPVWRCGTLPEVCCGSEVAAGKFCGQKLLIRVAHACQKVTDLAFSTDRNICAQEPKGQTSIQEIARFFHMPINQAGGRLGICPTVLKKICRKHGLSRWPHRKVRPPAICGLQLALEGLWRAAELRALTHLLGRLISMLTQQ